MADKKFKTGVDLQSTVKISSETAQRAMILDASGNLVSSAVTDTELGYLDGVTSSIQTQVDAKADLVGGKIPTSQLPALAITEVFTVADITARDALTVGTGDGEVQEGDVAIVTDASADVNITSGAASYIYNGSSWSLLKAGDEVLSVNSQTGTVVLDADDISDAATTNKYVTAADVTKLGHISVTQAVNLDTMESDIATNNAKVSADGSVTSHSDVTSAGSGIIISSAERTKLTNIEALADVTDATNVAAAGATMDADTDVSANGWVIDEDNMVSDSATKVPTQQSVKAYVDTQAAAGGNLSAGDIKETSFAGAADTATNLDVTGLAFANATVRSFTAHISVLVDATADLYETFNLTGIQKGASWDMAVESVGDDSLVSFTITAAGQVQYSKSTTAGWVSTTIKFRADTTSV
jgi:hypothetical protein